VTRDREDREDREVDLLVREVIAEVMMVGMGKTSRTEWSGEGQE
jgi:hypothetical protein